MEKCIAILNKDGFIFKSLSEKNIDDNVYYEADSKEECMAFVNMQQIKRKLHWDKYSEIR